MKLKKVSLITMVLLIASFVIGHFRPEVWEYYLKNPLPALGNFLYYGGLLYFFTALYKNAAE